MKNYLFFPDCFTAESINRCRFSLLKYLGQFNLTPPANISVIIYTNKAAAFEIFQPFFKEIKIVEATSKPDWSNSTALRKLLTGYSGNVLLCRSTGYIKTPLEPLFETIGSDRICYCLLKGETTTGTSPDHLFDNLFALGVSSTVAGNAIPALNSALSSDAYFTVYKKRPSFNALLKQFFDKNEEESVVNLVKKARTIDLGALEQEADDADKLPLLQRWIRRLTGRNRLLKHYQNKL